MTITEVRLTLTFNPLAHFPAASQVTHPTYAEVVETDGIINGYFNQQPSTAQSVLNIMFVKIETGKCSLG